MDSWELTLRADGYSESSLRSYRRAVLSLATWLAEHHPDVGPVDVTRDHVRGWIVATTVVVERGKRERFRHLPKMILNCAGSSTSDTPTPRTLISSEGIGAQRRCLLVVLLQVAFEPVGRLP